MGNLISQDSSSRSVGKARSRRYLQRFFLERLQRIVAVRRERTPLLEAGDTNLRLLDKAVYSTFCDCLDLDAGEDARTILRQQDAPPAGSEDPAPEPSS